MSRITERPCSCGSGQYPTAVYDARGIFVTYACDGCYAKKTSVYRPEIFTNSNYHVDEPIDED